MIIPAPQPLDPGGPREDFKPMPPELWNPPSGLLSDFVHYINKTANMPQPELALGNAAAAIGALVDGVVRTPGDLATNVYNVGIGRSGSGKDHSRKCTARLVDLAGLDTAAPAPDSPDYDSDNAKEAFYREMLGGRSMTSDAGLLNRLTREPATLYLLDECGHFLGRSTSNGAQNHEKAIVPELMMLYTSASKKYKGKDYADKPTPVVYKPCLSLYGTTTPKQFWGSLNADQLEDGFIGRCCIYPSSFVDPDWRAVDNKEPSSELVNRFSDWGKLGRQNGIELPMPPSTSNLDAIRGTIRVTTTPEAAQCLSDWRYEFKSNKRHLFASKDELYVLWTRSYEIAEKLATIAALDRIPRTHDGIRIEECTADWACKLANWLTLHLMKCVKHIPGSQAEKDANRVLEVVQEGGNGISKSDLTRKTQRMGKKRRGDAISDLIESRRIKAIPDGGGTRYVSMD